MSHPPFDYFGEQRRAAGELNSAIAGTEWTSFLAHREQLYRDLLGSLHDFGRQAMPAPDPTIGMQQGDISTGMPISPEQLQSLRNRADFWKIPNADSMGPQQLQASIDQARAGVHPATQATTGNRLALLGAGAEAFSSELMRSVGNLLGNVDSIPFAGQMLSKILRTDLAQNWLNSVADHLSESQMMIQAQQLPTDRVFGQFVTAAGKTAGFLVPMYMAWEGLGAVGAGGLTDAEFLAQKGATRALLRLGTRGALTSWALGDPNADFGDKAFNIGLGAILGGSQLYGTAGRIIGGGVLGGAFGGEIGDTPGDRTRNKLIGGAVGAVTLGLAPVAAMAYNKVRQAFPSPLDAANARGIARWEGIPVDQSEAPASPGEAEAQWTWANTPKQQSANPPQKLLPGPSDPGIGGPDRSEQISALIRSEPTTQIGPNGQMQPAPDAGLTAPATPGMIPANTEIPPGAQFQYDTYAAARQIASIPGTDVNFVQPGSIEALRRRGDAQLFESQRYAPQAGEPAQPNVDTSRPIAGYLEAPRPPYERGLGGMSILYDSVIQDYEHYQRMANDFEYYQQNVGGPGLINEATFASERPRYQHIADDLFAQGQAARYNIRQEAGKANAQLQGVTQGPSKLYGSKVAAAGGLPLKVYHGTPESFDEFDPNKLDTEALFGPGLYHTESPEIAAGYANSGNPKFVSLGNQQIAAKRVMDAYEQVKGLPMQFYPASPVSVQTWAGQLGVDISDLMESPLAQIRPAFLDIKNPFDLDKQWGHEEINALIDKLDALLPEYDWVGVRSALGGHPDFDAYGDVPMTAENGESVWNILTQADLFNQPQGPSEQAVVPALGSPPVGQRTLGKAGLNAALRRIGYDGLTHIGGARTGNDPHRVWIAFDPLQVHQPWITEPLNSNGAVKTAAELSKQATIVESGTLDQAAMKMQLGETDAVQAAKVTNPGGLSILKDIGKPIEVMQDHPDVKFIERPDGSLDAMIGEHTPEMVQDYQRWGVFSSQQVTTKSGVMGTISSINGKGLATVVRAAGGPPLRIKVENLLPSRFGDPIRSAPDIWNSFKADLMSYVNDEAQAAGMQPPEDIWDPRVAEQMHQHLQDYLNRRGINDPADRQVINEYVNRSFIEESKQLDPESHALQDKMVEEWTQAANDNELAGDMEVPESLEEKAANKGFIWIQQEGVPGGTLRDNLNPESGFEVPVDSPSTAEDFLRNMDRDEPDLNPASTVPIETMDAPPHDTYEPRSGHEETADALADNLNEVDAEWETIYDPTIGLGGSGAPPSPPPIGGPAPASGALPEGEGPSNKELWANLKKTNPNRWNEMNNRFKSNVFRYTRYYMSMVERVLNQRGIEWARPWMDYEALDTARIKSDNEARPWVQEFGQIMKEFRQGRMGDRIMRDGTVSRIRAIADRNAQIEEWAKLKDSHGYTDSQIQRLIGASDKLNEFYDRWHTFKTDGRSVGAETEIRNWMDRVRSRQAAGIDNPYDVEGLSLNNAYFKDFAKGSRMQMRLIDEREFGSLLIRSGFWDKYQAEPYQRFVENWDNGPFAQDIPTNLSNTMMEHARAMKYGFDPSASYIVRGIQYMAKNVLGVEMSAREASHMVGLPTSWAYQSMLGGRLSIFFRDAIQPMLALAKVRTPYMAGVYGDVLRINRPALADMYQRGLDGGWVYHEGPAMEGLGVFEEAGAVRPNDLLNLTDEQLARRERFARVLDQTKSLPDWLVRPNESNLSTLKWYGRQQQLQRAIVGESAWRQADEMLGEYRASQREAVLNGTPESAMQYREFAKRSFFSSFDEPIARRLQELVDSGQDAEAKAMFARETVKWSQFKYGRTEQPPIVRGGFGRVAYMFGNFTGQFLEGAVDALSHGEPIHRARYAMIVGGVSAGLYALENRTGWAFHKWAWPNALKFAGGPGAEYAAELVAAAGGLIASSEDRNPSPFQQEAVKDLSGRLGLPNPATFFPYSGYLRSAAEYSSASQGSEPLSQSLRYTITGDRGSGVSFRQLDNQQLEEFNKMLQQRYGHPGQGGIP